MSETLAVFGGTGRTGRHVVKYALDKGYKVQMLARDPTKVETQHEDLVVVEGDFANHHAIQQVVKGANYVICCAGGPTDPKIYPKDLMLNFVKDMLYPILEAESSVKVFLYQAGRFSPAPEQPSTRLISFLRYSLGYLMGWEPLIQDNERVTFFMAEQKTHFQYIITRPGYLVPKKEGEEDVELVPEYINFPLITFQDLAKFSVNALQDASLYGTYPFLAPKTK